MPIDASIYQQNPLRSVADYEGDYQKQAIAKQMLQQNALALQTGQMGLQDRQRAVEEAGIVRNALMGLGPNADDGQRINALKRTGTQTGFAAADALEKAMVAREKEAAGTAKTKVETQGLTDKQKRDAITFNLQQLSAVNNPQQYASWLDGGVKSGLMTQQEADAEKTRIPQTPQEFAKLVNDQKMAGVELAKQFDIKAAAARDAEAGRHNTATEKNAAGQLAVAQGNLGVSRERLNVEKSGAGKPPAGYRAKPDGTLEFIPGGPADPARTGEAKMTEDQGKATGWLVQADNAFKNMKDALDPAKGGSASAAYPGVNDAIAAIPSFGLGEAVANSMRGAPRQKFMQASSSLSEALLRAATGAGVNKDEAAQKIRELTPVFGEDKTVTKQKMDAIPLYVESLKVRAGPGAGKLPGIVDRARPSPTVSDPVAEALKKYGG